MSTSNSPPGTTIEATVGVPFTVSLETPVAGYRWQVEIPSLVELTAHATTPGAGVGGAAADVFAFLPRAAGTGVLRFVLKRPWETTPNKSVEYPVKVTP